MKNKKSHKLVISASIFLALLLASCSPVPTFTGLRISKPSMDLIPGETAVLEVSTIPATRPDEDLELIWQSTDDSVAEVDGDGNVTAVAPGKAIISVSSPNGFASGCMLTVHPLIVLSEELPLSEALKAVGDGKPETLMIAGTLTQEDCRTINSIESLRHLDISRTRNEELWPGSFIYNTYLETVALPAGLTAIPDNLFYMAQDLKVAEIPSGVKTIGNNAFASTLLASATLPEGLETIGENAFGGTKIETISIPSSVTEIGAKAFKGCSDLHTADIKASITGIPAELFSKSGLREVTFPEGLTSIGENAFSYTDFRRFTVPETVTSIGASAFMGMSNLQILHLPDGLTVIPDGMCRECIRLESVNIPSKVESIGDFAFYYCQIKSANDILVLPDPLKEIGGYAFTGLKDTTQSIRFGSGLEEIGPYAFAVHAKITEITLPGSLLKLSDSAFSSSVKEIAFTSAVPELIPSMDEGGNLKVPYADPMWEVDVTVPAGQLEAYRTSVWGKGSDAYTGLGTPLRKYYDPAKMHEPANDDKEQI